MVDFKGSHYLKEVMLYAVFFYVRYAVSYRSLEDILAERGVPIDHATLNRWVVKYSPLIAAQAKCRKYKPSGSWRMDETYIEVKGKWMYFYRAVTKHGKTLDFMLSEHRFIKKLTRLMKGFKSFQSASATLDGIDVAHMIRKQQFSTSGQSAFQQFAALAA